MTNVDKVMTDVDDSLIIPDCNKDKVDQQTINLKKYQYLNCYIYHYINCVNSYSRMYPHLIILTKVA